MIDRRAFIGMVAGGSLVAVSIAGAQQPAKVRRIGVLMGYAENDSESQLRVAGFKSGLAALGWVERRNLSIDVRWSAGDINRVTELARELVALRLELIVSNTTPGTAALQRETQTIPIVMATVSDPVGSGFVKSLPRPGGNITGFANLDLSATEKRLQLLKEIAPHVTRVAVIFNPDTAPYAERFLPGLKATAAKFGVNAFAAAVRSESDIQEAVAELGREPNGGLVVMTDSFMLIHHKLVIGLAARHKIPAIYYSGFNAVDGGLISYGVDGVDQFRRVAAYVDRILRGEKPAELPVQQPEKYMLFVNLKTAKALGLTIPQSLLLRADEVIQ